MSESIEKKLIAAVADCWNEVSPLLLGSASTLSLLSSREVSSDSMRDDLELATTWSWGFAASCSGAISGVVICLFKSADGEEIDRLVNQPPDGIPKPGGRSLISSVLDNAAAKLTTTDSGPITFDPTIYIDLTINKKRLAAIVGDNAHIGTFTLSLGEGTTSEALVLYAPNGSLEIAPVPAETVVAGSFEQNAETSSNQSEDPRGSGELRRLGVSPRNIERLLEVELDVVVRFGVTNIPLRDVVRMGVGTMIELNRAVDEPVELLVNGHPLARGEVVVVDGYYGVRITEISPVSERASFL